MKKQLVIIGASGHGKVVADIALKMNRWEQVVFIDQNPNLNEVMGIEVLDPIEVHSENFRESDFFVAIGSAAIRQRLITQLMVEGAHIATLIHPSSVIGLDVELGIGTVVMAGVVINSSTRIGKGCIVNTSASLDHDNVLGDYVHVSPGSHTAGGVRIGNGSWLGIGSTVIQNIEIAEHCIIGAGAVVISDLMESGTYVGVPAKLVKNR